MIKLIIIHCHLHFGWGIQRGVLMHCSTLHLIMSECGWEVEVVIQKQNDDQRVSSFYMQCDPLASLFFDSRHWDTLVSGFSI